VQPKPGAARQHAARWKETMPPEGPQPPTLEALSFCKEKTLHENENTENLKAVDQC